MAQGLVNIVKIYNKGLLTEDEKNFLIKLQYRGDHRIAATLELLENCDMKESEVWEEIAKSWKILVQLEDPLTIDA